MKKYIKPMSVASDLRVEALMLTSSLTKSETDLDASGALSKEIEEFWGFELD